MGIRTIAGMMLMALSTASLACSGADAGGVGAHKAALGGAQISLASSTVSANPLTPGQTQVARATLRSDSDVSGLIVDIRIYDAGDQLVSKKSFDAVSIAAGGTVTLELDYDSPSSLAAGTYHVSVGVWDSSWTTYLYETDTFFDVGAGAAAAPSPSNATPPTTNACNFPAWVRYQYYPAGSIVSYEGAFYIAKFANPGYVPTISTYFWAPYACDAGSGSSGSTTTPPPSPSPAPAPSPGSSTSLPAKVVGGYFTTWDARNGVSLRSIVDNTNYNLIYVAFATGVSASSGSLTLSAPPGATDAADFKSQVAYANSKGKEVIVSVGGYFDLGGGQSGYVLDSSSKVDDFMTSMRDLHDNWGFNGMDWDLEHGDRPDVSGIVDASRRMKSAFGASWIIACAPGVNLSSWVGAGGVLDTLGPSGWDLVGEQVYYLGVPESTYQSMIVDRMTVLSNKYGASKVVLGNMYKTDVGGSSDLSDPSNDFVDISTTKSGLATLRGNGINIRGSFLWTIQSDGDAGYQWQGQDGVGGDILSHP